MKGHKYEVSGIPLEVKFNKKNFEKNYERKREYNEQIYDNIEIDTYYCEKTIIDEDILSSNFSDSNYSPEKAQETDWPSLSPKDIKKTYSFKDYSHIKKINSTEKSNDNNTLKNVDISKDVDIYKKINKKEENIEYKENIININYLKSIEQNKNLENDIIILKLENKKLNENLENYRNLIKSNKVYEEILYNINTINNQVTEDFLSTNYSEYLII